MTKGDIIAMDIKVTEVHGEYDYEPIYEITVEKDGKRALGFYVGCIEPEDASLGRDLSFAYSAVDFFRLGYEAGAAGATVTYETKDEEDND